MNLSLLGFGRGTDLPVPERVWPENGGNIRHGGRDVVFLKGNPAVPIVNIEAGYPGMELTILLDDTAHQTFLANPAGPPGSLKIVGGTVIIRPGDAISFIADMQGCWRMSSYQVIQNIVQIQQTNYDAVLLGNVIMPQDDTIPQITEGFEFMTQAITPRWDFTMLMIEVQWMMSQSAGNINWSWAFFQDAIADALTAGMGNNAGVAQCPSTFSVAHIVPSLSTVARTYRFRAGSTNATSIAQNGITTPARRLGAIVKSWMRVTEYVAQFP